MKNIIFLDIDGPVISEPQYYIDWYCSINRTVMNTNAIGYLNFLCRNCNALIVTNSSHNYIEPNDIRGTLQEDLIKHGIKPEYFHENWRTGFPRVNSGNRRLDAILNWFNANGYRDQIKTDNVMNYEWVAFDDENFTSNKRLCLVNFSDGINFQCFKKAYEILSGKPFIYSQ